MKNEEINKREKFTWDNITEKAVIIFTLIMLTIFPLFCGKKYLELTKTRVDMLKVLVGAIVIITLVMGIIKVVRRKRIFEVGYRAQISITDICALVFAYGIFFSCLNSELMSESFLGEQGRMLGGIVLWLCIAAYFVVSRYYKFSKKHLWFLVAANAVMWIIAVLNFWNVDVLGIREEVGGRLWGTYMGTLGSINTNAGYCSVLLSVFIVCYFLCEEKKQRCIYYIMILLGFYFGYTTKSESWLLGVGAVMLVLLWKAFESYEKLWRFQAVWWAYLAASVLMKITIWIMGRNEDVPVSLQQFNQQWILNFLLKKEVLLLQLVILLLALILCKKWKCNCLKRIRIVMFSFIGGVAVAIVLLMVWANTTNGTEGWRKYAQWSDSFGSDRGYIWRLTISEFNGLPFLKKLFGVGPNCLVSIFSQQHIEETLSMFKAMIIDAHNECLQFLATTGFVGMISYLGMQISVVTRNFKMRKKKPLLLIGQAAVIAYMAQGLVNNPLVHMLPLYFICMGMIESELRRS